MKYYDLIHIKKINIVVQNNETKVFFSIYWKEICLIFNSFEAEQADIDNFVKRRLKRHLLTKWTTSGY